MSIETEVGKILGTVRKPKFITIAGALTSTAQGNVSVKADGNVILSYGRIAHPNCGMGIIQSLYFTRIPSKTTAVLKPRTIARNEAKYWKAMNLIFQHVANSQKKILFTFQKPSLVRDDLIKAGFIKLTSYPNYNYGDSLDRQVLVFDLKNRINGAK
jgi:hypothetical protein